MSLIINLRFGLFVCLFKDSGSQEVLYCVHCVPRAVYTVCTVYCVQCALCAFLHRFSLQVTQVTLGRMKNTQAA